MSVCVWFRIHAASVNIQSANIEAAVDHYLEKSIIFISSPFSFQLAPSCLYIILTPVLCWCVSPFHVADYHDQTPSQSERSGVTHTHGVMLWGRMHFWNHEKGHFPCTLPTSTTGDMLAYTRKALPPLWHPWPSPHAPLLLTSTVVFSSRGQRCSSVADRQEVSYWLLPPCPVLWALWRTAPRQ